MPGVINKILNHSAVDGPGNRMVFFFQGCNFNCSYCHNPETINVCNHCGICVDHCNSKALELIDNKVEWNKTICSYCDKCIHVCPNSSSPKTEFLSVKELMLQIEKNRPFISGITISGGECTQQYNFVKALLKECKQRNISAFIDTNLHLETEKLIALSHYFDKAMPDVKIYNNTDHKILTGQSNNLVFKNIELLLAKNKIYEIRTVVYPEFDYKETVEKVSTLINKYNNKVIYKLIKFRPSGNINDTIMATPDMNIMLKLKQISEKHGLKNTIVV